MNDQDIDYYSDEDDSIPENKNNNKNSNKCSMN